MPIVSRSEWGARKPLNRTMLNVVGLQGIAVHYTGMNADEQTDHAKCAGRVKGIQNYHMDTNGWSDLAYSFCVCKHGSVYEGRGWGFRTAAQGTDPGNDGYHAVCFLGDDTANRDDVTDPGRAALVEVIQAGQKRYPHALQVRPHSFFHSTGCPGAELKAWIVGRPWEKKDHKPPWELVTGRTVLGTGRLSNPLFVRKVKAALVEHGKVTLREKK